MALSCSDYVDRAHALLKDAGYTFHTDDDSDGLPVPGCIPEHRHWFCWTDGKCDVETGPDCDDELSAQLSALEHWFQNALIVPIAHRE